jgi:hypothetical protein
MGRDELSGVPDELRYFEADPVPAENPLDGGERFFRFVRVVAPHNGLAQRGRGAIGKRGTHVQEMDFGFAPEEIEIPYDVVHRAFRIVRTVCCEKYFHGTSSVCLA